VRARDIPSLAVFEEQYKTAWMAPCILIQKFVIILAWKVDVIVAQYDISSRRNRIGLVLAIVAIVKK